MWFEIILIFFDQVIQFQALEIWLEINENLVKELKNTFGSKFSNNSDFFVIISHNQQYIQINAPSDVSKEYFVTFNIEFSDIQGDFYLKCADEKFYYYPMKSIFQETYFDIQSKHQQTLNCFINDSKEIQIQIVTNSPLNDDTFINITKIDVFRKQFICSPECKVCESGSKCLECFTGLPIDNVCPQCLNGFRFDPLKNNCIRYCNKNQIYKDGICQNIQRASYIQPQNHYFLTDKFIKQIKILVNSSYQQFQCNYLKTVRIIFFNQHLIEMNTLISFFINSTVVGSIIKRSDFEYIKHNIQVTEISEKQLVLDIKLENLQQTFFLIIKSNISDIVYLEQYEIEVIDECAQNCVSQQLPYDCKECMQGYFLHNDGNCYQSFFAPFDTENDQFCSTLENQTVYSKYYAIEFSKDSLNCDYYQQYQLVFQNGINFLLGQNIYYSKIQDQYVFGGPQIWSQAKFKSQYFSLAPHHSITIGFNVIFGPDFSETSQFTLTIDSSIQINKTKNDAFLTCLDQLCVSICKKFEHTADTLTIEYECYGSDNNPLNAYCAFYNLYITVHYCEPMCDECNDENNCLKWSKNSSNIFQYQRECEDSQFYDKSVYQCVDCPQLCQTCQAQRLFSSQAQCLTCYSTAIINQYYECKCNINQYIESNLCLDCPYQCTQCINQNYCTNCLNSNNRELQNGQCNCFKGYYDIPNDPQCKLCHSLCLTCEGPTENDCLSCDQNKGFQLLNNNCQCPQHNYYSIQNSKCQDCHQNCLTCFNSTIQSCLSCDDQQQNRILQGLQCQCKNGYYELNNNCIDCPIIEDNSLDQCYHYCKDNIKQWYSINCNECDIEYLLINNSCVTICGDLLIKGNEQCDDNNNIMYDGCYNCQYQCPLNCQTCNSNTILPCQDVCGDGYLTGNEECEDGNDIQFDGCYQCKYQCQQPCTKCIRGICFECDLGWELNKNNQCETTCGDGLLIGDEYCESFYHSIYEGCDQCQFQCREGCLKCDYEQKKCLQCPDGFYPEDYYCKNTCGDGQVVIDSTGFFTEECDDLINYYSDQCESCKFKTHTCLRYVNVTDQTDNTKKYEFICQECQEGYTFNILEKKCQLINYRILSADSSSNLCQQGYELIGTICQSICGDGIITTDEDCDDQNMIFEDGCHFCQFECGYGCQDCYQGQCLQCESNFNLFDNQCYMIDNIQNQLEVLIQNQEFFIVLIQDDEISFRSSYEFQISEETQNQKLSALINSQNLIKFCQENQNQQCFQINQDNTFESLIQLMEFYIKIQIFSNIQYQEQLAFEIFENKQQQLFEQSTQNIDNSFSISSQFDVYQQCNLNEYYEMSNNLWNRKPSEQKDLVYIFDIENYIIFNINEQEICGDGIITGSEQCDDMNDDSNDGCFQCQYNCQENCEFCLKGECFQCHSQYQLENGKCELIDNLNCFYYSNNKCLICNEGYELSTQLQICVSDIKWHEEKIFYDLQVSQIEEKQSIQTIQNNKLCNHKCFDCYYDQICLKCQQGYDLDVSQIYCLPICGDGIVVQEEECDDGNFEYFNCQNCQLKEKNYVISESSFQIYEQCEHFNYPICNLDKYQYNCQENCEFCLKGECYQCHSQYQLENGKCELIGNLNCFYYSNNKCLICNEGYELSTQLQICVSDIKWLEEKILYDLQVSQIEEKQSIQTIQNNKLCNHKCFDCYYDQICLKCSEGYNLDESQINCVPICGDGIVTEEEECDDSNSEQYDGCNQCYFQCIQNCLVCNKGVCSKCQKNYFFDNNFNYCILLENTQTDSDSIEQEMLNYYQYKNIVIHKSKCQLENCQICEYRQCLQCNLGYYGTQCLPHCGDGIRVGKEMCDDNNQIEFDGCFRCEYSCPQNCLKCYQGKCVICKVGYYLLNNYCYITNSPIVSYIGNLNFCGNKIVELNEHCDDGNQFEFDGCHNCQFSCDIHCKDCEFGICKKCLDHFNLNDYSRCESICGDNYVTVYTNEQCENQINQINSQCQQCTYNCGKNCLYCNDLICLHCVKGTYQQGLLCEPKCGDKIIFQETEECDDGNLVEYDGCFNCEFSCMEGCAKCQGLKCDGVCKKGYYFKNNICVTRCGDGIIAGIEECDDRNDVQFDGCYNCQFSCPQNCELCVDGICLKCEYDFIYDPTKKLCYFENKCGNGKIDENETCDDNNSDFGDGCFNCQPEEGWKCQSNICQKIGSLNLELQFLNQTASKYYIKISFNEKLQLNNRMLTDYLGGYLENYNDYEYEINFISNSIQIVEAVIEIYTPHSETIFTLILKEKMISIYEQELNPNSFSIILQTTQTTSQTIQKAQSVKDANKYIIISTLCVGGISFMFGQVDIFLEIVSTLQFQAYLKYINLQFPINLQIYFQSSEVLSIQPVLNVFKIDYILEKVTFKGMSVHSKGKFQEYGEDCDFITSIFSQILQASCLLFLIYKQSLIRRLNYLIINSEKYYFLLTYLYSKFQSKNFIYLHDKIYSFSKIFLKLEKQVNIQGLRTLFVLNSWDLLFKSFLFLNSSTPFESFRSSLSTILCLTFIFVYLILILHNFNCSLISKRIMKVEFQLMQFQDFELLKIMIFQFILIFWQDNQNIQLVSLSLLNLTQLMNIIRFKKVFNLFDFISKIVVEGSVTFVMFTSFVYIDDYDESFSQETRMQFGEMHTYILLLALVFIMLKLPIQKSKNFLLNFFQSQNRYQSNSPGFI